MSGRRGLQTLIAISMRPLRLHMAGPTTFPMTKHWRSFSHLITSARVTQERFVEARKFRFADTRCRNGWPAPISRRTMSFGRTPILRGHKLRLSNPDDKSRTYEEARDPRSIYPLSQRETLPKMLFAKCSSAKQRHT